MSFNVITKRIFVVAYQTFTRLLVANIAPSVAFAAPGRSHKFNKLPFGARIHSVLPAIETVAGILTRRAIVLGRTAANLDAVRHIALRSGNIIG